MPEVNYKVDLFYGDIGFTSDYANVLQFDDADARDTYFDNINDKDTFDNTDFNNIQLSGNTIKLAFVDAIKLAKLEKYNYIRILTRLYGSLDYVSKYDYGFIVDYTIISSNSNVTVVEFTFETDLWQNFQFDFELKECSVERSHIDRWSPTSTKSIYTRPSMELIESFMQKFKEPQKFYKEGRFYDDNLNIFTAKYAIVLITLTQSIRYNPSTGQVERVNGVYTYYFPVLLDNRRAVARKDIAVIEYFPTLSQVLLGNLTDYIAVDPGTIVNMQLIYNPTIDTNPGERPAGSGYYQTALVGKDGIERTPANVGTYDGVRYAAVWDNAGSQPISGNKELISINISKPVKPVDDADYSTTYEPMLYKDPIMKRYITNFIGDTVFQIPDNVMNIDTQFSITTVFDSVKPYNIVEMSADDYPMQNLTSLATLFMGVDCDVLNDYWKQYLMENREADRQMMWANILTGGIAESGSTAVSAGIGYRSNMERAELADISSNLSPMTSMQMNKMYTKYAKQAMGFSMLGGITAMSANAIGNYARQVTNETAIKNKPSNMILKGNAYSINVNTDCNMFYCETRCDDKSFEQYANVFKKFGYYIGGVIVPNIKSRKFFNYIKTNGAILTGSLNQSVLAKLAKIFDNGVTIWHMDYVTNLYDYSKENIERTLIGE